MGRLTLSQIQILDSSNNYEFEENGREFSKWICSTSLLKTLREKEKLLVTSNFSFSHSVFYPCKELSAIFIKFEIVVCKLFRKQQI